MVLVRLLSGCVSRPCLCDPPNGPRVDFEAVAVDVEAVLAGEREGTVLDAGRPDAEGCVDAQRPFVLDIEVSGPRGCRDGRRSAPHDCTDARSAWFDLDGTVAIGEQPAVPLTGYLALGSEKPGVQIDQLEFTADAADFPHQTLEVLTEGEILDDTDFLGLEWQRRLSDDDAEIAVWEVCTLQLAPG